MHGDLSKPMADIAMLFHGRPKATLNSRLLDVVSILLKVGYVKESAGLVVLTQRAEEILADAKTRQERKGAIIGS